MIKKTTYYYWTIPVDLRRLESANFTLWNGWIWIIKNSFKLSLAWFNMYDIYTMYSKRMPVRWTLVRHA